MSFGKVVAIFICPIIGQPMQLVQEVEAIAGAGLEGDRYRYAEGSWNKGRLGKRQVSLIEIEDFQKENARLPSPFLPIETRRNILTEGIRLMELYDKEFLIGTVLMRGVKYCEPCPRPGDLSGKKGFHKAFANYAGILAEVVTHGFIRAGDDIYEQ